MKTLSLVVILEFKAKRDDQIIWLISGITQAFITTQPLSHPCHQPELDHSTTALGRLHYGVPQAENRRYPGAAAPESPAMAEK